MKNNKETKKNLILIIIYKMLSFDLLFYYAVSYLFLINVKGLTTSQIIFADSFYPLFKLIFQVPCTILIQKIGKKSSLILANIAVAIYGLLILGITGTSTIIIGNAFLAFSFVIKGMAESTFLYDLIENTSKKRDLFSKYESISTSGYYFLDAITSIITGFLYIFNPYLPLTLSFIVSIIATILTFNLKENHLEHTEKNQTKEVQNSTNKNEFIVYLKDLAHAFKYIIKSARLRSLILFNALIVSIFSLMVTLQKSLLTDVNIPSTKFGIIFAIMGFIACFSTGSSNSIHNKLHNKTLAILGITFISSIILSASVILLNLPLFLVYYILLIMTAIQYFIKGPYYTLIKRYLNSFCDSDMRLKIYSAKALIEYISSAIISIICSNALNYFSNAITTFFLGIISLIIMLVLVNYMNSRVGLKPEEYSKQDILETL